MPGQAQVDVAITSIERAWRGSGYDDFWIRLATDHTGNLAPLRAAVSVANDAAAKDGLELRAYSVTPCPGGFAVQIGPALERNPIHAWVHHFAEALQHEGLAGRLAGAVEAKEPKILAAGEQPTPTLFARFALPSTVAEDTPRWEVGAEQTQQGVRTALDWAFAQSGTVILTQNLFSVQVEGIDLHPLLERALHAAGSAGIDVFDVAEQRARHAALGPQAAVLFQDIGETRQNAVEELRDLASRLPPPLDFAFVRIAQRGIRGIHALDSVQALPGIRELHVRYNPHLLNRYLPDAHGIQIVTDAHLNAAHDLSGWTVTDLGQDRHLVMASDLEPWYGTTLPDPATLTRARADWSGALLTEEVIAAVRQG
jgi:hypothetical protein